MVQIYFTRYVPKIHLTVCLDIIDMKNTCQGADMKWNIMKNVPWPNSVIFVHKMLQPQMDIFTVMVVPALQRKQTRTGNTALLSRNTNEQVLPSGAHDDRKYLGLFGFCNLEVSVTEKQQCRRILFHTIIFLHEL